MRLLYRKILDQLLTTFFNENLLVDDELVDQLYENLLFSTAEKDDVEKEVTNHGKIGYIIRILSIKDDNSYETFKKCLEKSNHHVVLEMVKLESDLKKDCEDCTVYITKLLQANYSTKQGSCVGLNDIQNTVIDSVRRSKEHLETLKGILDEDFFKECIMKAFPVAKERSEIVNISSPGTFKHGKKKSPRSVVKQHLVIDGITKIKCEQQHIKESGNEFNDSDSDEETESNDENQSACCCDAAAPSFTTEEFASLIEEILKKSSSEWDVNIPKKIREHKIDSDVYDVLSDNDKKELFPRIGERIKIEQEWQKVKTGQSMFHKTQKNSRTYFEHLRRFDRPASEKTIYRHGSIIKHKLGRTGNLLTPIHRFFMFEETGKVNETGEKILLLEVIKFASACMNDRTNGTFYAGITKFGEVAGCEINAHIIDSKLTIAIKEHFKEYQIESALRCIRPPQCIEVVGNDSRPERLYVIEVDVVPFSKIIDKQSFFVKCNRTSKDQFYRCNTDGHAKKQSQSEIEEYLQRQKGLLIDQRIDAEKNKPRGRKGNLNKRLKDFLCGGENEFDESLYPVLVLSPLEVGDNQMFSDGEFFRNIPWRAIFDFNKKDDDNGLQNYLEKKYAKTFITHNVEDFNQRKRDEKLVKQTLETITDSVLPAWIYCQGSAEKDHLTSEDARTWKYETSESFRKALEFYKNTIPDSRGRIIIPLFKKQNNVLTEAIAEILYQFEKQCLILSPSRSISAITYDDLKQRPNAFPPKSSIDDFFLLGLPWNQVNECVTGILKTNKVTHGIQIPRSNGVPCVIDEKFVSELSDLKIVSINECQEIEQMTTEERYHKEKEVREFYYQGGTIQWENFYFREQILVRDIHKELENHVRLALEDNDTEGHAVAKVAVYHQPGSGGSTTSRQILWDLKSTYRCCIVSKITDQTCDQIGQFRKIGENDDEDNDIKPVLVLFDSNDEEQIEKFVDDLEYESDKYSCELFCVLLICFRVSALPLQRPAKYTMLRQALSHNEHDWFKEKYRHLLEICKNKGGCDPQTLLAFNIMKENFNMEAINKSVRDFVADHLINSKQMKFLKHLSFLNAYDLHYQPVPVSCFDPILSPPVQWIKHLPPSIRVLTSRCRKQGFGGHSAAIRISNYLLSKTVLKAVLELESEKGHCQGSTIGEVALEVMESDCVRRTLYKYEHKLLGNIIGDIMKKRDLNKENGKREKFSPLIMELLEQNDSDQALRIVESAYDITDDPLVAQQLARLFAELGSWTQAIDAIDMAIEQKPNNSYLVHTKGQLYKDQMMLSCSKPVKETDSFPPSLVNKAIDLSRRAIECYRQSQNLCENQQISQQNPAGYESEILIVLELLRLFSRCQALNPLSLYLREPNTCEHIDSCHYSFLKDLQGKIDVTIEKLERILYGSNRNGFHTTARSLYTTERKELDKHKKELVLYFQSNITQVPFSKQKEPFIPPDIYSFLSAYRFQNFELLLKTIQSMHTRCHELRSNHLRIFLAMCLSVGMKVSLSDFPVKPHELLSLSRKYYETRGSQQSDLAKLESHLYFVSFHWPLKSRTDFEGKMCPFSAWFKAVQEWLSIETKSERRNDKLLFYLGNRPEFPGFVTIDNNISVQQQQQLEKLEGTVNQNGTEISIKIPLFRSEVEHSIKIPFFKRLRRNTVYNRKTEVVIGFGLQGPRADWLHHPSSFIMGRKSNRSYTNLSIERHYNSVDVKHAVDSQQNVVYERPLQQKWKLRTVQSADSSKNQMDKYNKNQNSNVGITSHHSTNTNLYRDERWVTKERTVESVSRQNALLKSEGFVPASPTLFYNERSHIHEPIADETVSPEAYQISSDPLFYSDQPLRYQNADSSYSTTGRIPHPTRPLLPPTSPVSSCLSSTHPRLINQGGWNPRLRQNVRISPFQRPQSIASSMFSTPQFSMSFSYPHSREYVEFANENKIFQNNCTPSDRRF